MIDVVIFGERVRLRRIERSDLPRFVEWLNDPEVREHLAVDWRNRSGELGIALGRRDCWGKGFGTDAVRTLCRWGFAELNLHRVHLKVYEDNPRGIACYEKVGFRQEGRLRHD